MSRFYVSVFVLCFAVSAAISAEDANTYEQVDFFNMSLEELGDIEVVSASRQKQKLSDASVAMSIITAEDIHYSGATNLYEILQFSPGMDVLRIDRNRYASGVRGLHEVYSDRTLVLLNGRAAESPLFGGSEFMRLPLIMEDIDRIEIVRGPGGAAWGANAYNGVINIITKKPEDCLGFLLSTQWNTFGDDYEQFRWAAKEKNWSWRISGGYRNQVSSSDALDRSYYSPLSGEFDTRDFSRGSVIDTEFINQLSDDTQLQFGIGRSHNDLGSFPFLLTFPEKDGFEETVRAFAKILKTIDEDTSVSLQWTGNFNSTKLPSVLKYSSTENDFEGQLNFSPIENHSVTIGANVRYTTLEQDIMSADDLMFKNPPIYETAFGAFIIDRWQVTDRLALEGQFRGDYYSGTGNDWSMRTSAIYTVDEERDGKLRLSIAKAFKAPKTSTRELETHRLLIAPDIYMASIMPNGNLENEEVLSYELGYDTKLSKDLTFSTNVYWQRYSKLIGYYDEVIIPDAAIIYTPENLAGADSFGWENELAWNIKNLRLSAWYTYENFMIDDKTIGDRATQGVRGFLPAAHKAGLTARVFLQDDFVFNVNYKYNSFTDGVGYDAASDALAFNQIDLTLSKAFSIRKTRGEFMLGISDILNETETSIESSGGDFYLSETPGRMLFARVQIRF